MPYYLTQWWYAPFSKDEGVLYLALVWMALVTVDVQGFAQRVRLVVHATQYNSLVPPFHFHQETG